MALTEQQINRNQNNIYYKNIFEFLFENMVIAPQTTKTILKSSVMT